MRSIRYAFLAAIVVATLIPASPAAAQTPVNIACLGAPDAGFTDVNPLSLHKEDIDCISWFQITVQSGTYGPAETVSRWQMALFLIRTFSIDQAQLPDGSGQLFTDLGSLPVDTQLAINQLMRLGITAGVGPGIYDPNGTVTRWQMTLFLARLVRVAGVALPDGSAQGFTDIGGLSAEVQQAINQARQLGIAFGTSTSTFTPDAAVTREQMASFLARTLNVIWTLPLLDPGLLTCSPPLEQDLPGTTCAGALSWLAGQTFTIREGWIYTNPLIIPGPIYVFGTSFQLFVDGAAVTVAETTVPVEGVAYQHFAATVVGGLSGVHTIEGRWLDNGVVDLTVTMTVDFVGV